MSLQATSCTEERPPLNISEDAWMVELHHDVCVRFVETVTRPKGRRRGRDKETTSAWVGRVRRMRRQKNPDKRGGYVEYTRPVGLPWITGDPHVEVQCEWYRPTTGRSHSTWTLGNVEVQDLRWVHVACVCAPVVITHRAETYNPRLFELDQASQSLVRATAAGRATWG